MGSFNVRFRFDFVPVVVARVDGDGSDVAVERRVLGDADGA